MSGGCTGPECSKPVFRTGLCFGHYRQRQESRPLRPLLPRRQTLTERRGAAALAYAEAETEAEYVRASERLRRVGYRHPRCAAEGCKRRRWRGSSCYHHARRINSTPRESLGVCATSSR